MNIFNLTKLKNLNTFKISIYKSTLYLIIILNFLIGGLLSILNIIDYRPVISIIFFLPILFMYNHKINTIVYLLILFSIYIIFVSFYNGIAYSDMLIGLRMALIPLVVYLYIEAVYKKYIVFDCNRFKKFLYYLAIIQLPVILFQIIFYEQIELISNENIGFNDIRFGTFYLKGDPTMSLFLGMISLYVIIYEKRKSSLHYLVIGCSILSIYLSGARIVQISFALILLYHYMFNLSLERKISYSFIGLILIGILLNTNIGQFVIQDLAEVYRQITFQEDMERGIENLTYGGYARYAALYIFLNSPILFFGFGPSAFVDPITQELALGLHGFYFLNYAELGLIGLLFMIFILYKIVMACGKKTINKYFLFLFLTLGITVNLMNNVANMLVLFLMLSLIRHKVK